jgi:hypothetical protein
MLWAGRAGLNSDRGKYKISSFRHRVQTGSGAHPASYRMGTRGPFPGGKAVTAHLHLVSRLKIRGIIHLLPQYVFKAWFSVKHRDNFTLPIRPRKMTCLY